MVAGEAIRQVPGGCLVVEAFERLCSANDEAVQSARFDALDEEVRRLTASVERLEARLEADGIAPERPDLIAAEHEVSEFVRAITAAPSREKREALVNAATCQHDPRLGPLASRRFWWGVVRDLSDLEVETLKLFGAGAVFAAEGKVYVAPGLRWLGKNGVSWAGDEGAPVEAQSFPREHAEAVAHGVRLLEARRPPLVSSPPRNSAGPFVATTAGVVALRYIVGEEVSPRSNGRP